MRGTIRQRINGWPVAWRPLGDFLVILTGRLTNRTITAPGLVIKAGASTLAKAGNAFHAMVSDGSVGRIQAKAANTDMAALVGTVTNARHNVYVFMMDKTGTLSSAMGVEATTLAGVTFPPIPEGVAVLGYVYINPTGTGNFVGGTTALDDATVVPNAVYRDVVGPFDPTMV